MQVDPKGTLRRTLEATSCLQLCHAQSDGAMGVSLLKAAALQVSPSEELSHDSLPAVAPHVRSGRRMEAARSDVGCFRHKRVAQARGFGAAGPWALCCSGLGILGSVVHDLEILCAPRAAGCRERRAVFAGLDCTQP